MANERVTIQRNAFQISDVNPEEYAKEFHELFYGSQKRRARTLFDALERKLEDNAIKTPFPNILTSDTFYAILNGVDFGKKRNQFSLIKCLTGNKEGNKDLRNLLFGEAFQLSNPELPQAENHISGITLDDAGLSRRQLRATLSDEDYSNYHSVWSSKRRKWESEHPVIVSNILKGQINTKVDTVVMRTKSMLKNLLATDIDFAFDLLSKIPELENANAENLVSLAHRNPGAALGILSNSKLHGKISKEQAEEIFTHLLDQPRNKKVNAMLRTYVINLLNADAAASPAFRAAQLQAFFNHPSRLAEEFKIPRLLLEKYWAEGNFADKSDQAKANFFARNDRNDVNNPRKQHPIRSFFSFKNSKYFNNLYQAIFVEIKPAGAAAPELPVPPPPREENSDDHESSATEEAARLETERKATEEAARLETERNAAVETARLEAQRKATEKAARLEAERKAAEDAKAKAAKPVISASMDIESQTTKIDVAIPDDALFETLRDQLNAVNAQRKAAEAGPHTPPPSSAGKIARLLDDGIPDSAEKKKPTPAHIRRNSDGIPDSVEKPATATHTRRKSFDDGIADSPAKSARAGDMPGVAPINLLPTFLGRGRGRAAQPIYDIPTDGSVLILPPSSKTKMGGKK